MGMNTDEWFERLLEHYKMNKNFNLETVIFLLSEIETMPTLMFNGRRCLDYFRVRKLAEEARKIAVDVVNRTCRTCGAQTEEVRPGKVQCRFCG
jgi:hypothetical protein